MFWLKVVDFIPLSLTYQLLFFLPFLHLLLCVCAFVCVFKSLKINDNQLKVHTHSHSHTKRCISVTVNKPSSILVMPKNPSRKLPIQQHGLATVLQTYSSFFSSVLANFSIDRAFVFTGFNNLKVMLVSVFSPPSTSLLFFKKHCDSVLFQL